MDETEANHSQAETAPKMQVYVTLVTAGSVVTETYSVAEAMEKGILESGGYNLTGKGITGVEAPTGEVCSECGFSERDFEQWGRLGCPACYDTFISVIPGILANVHRGREHVGKFPAGVCGNEIIQNRIRYLEKELSNAVRKEYYEDAARLRDLITKLRSESSGTLEAKPNAD